MAKSFSLQDLLLGEPVNLRFVTRFSALPKTHDETVAEHSYFVALYSMIIGEHLEREGIDINFRRLLSYAIVHDLDEALTGDFIRTFKYSSDSLRNEIMKATKVIMKKLSDKYNIDKTYWEDSKETSTIEGKIVMIADFLSVLSFVFQELRAGNGSFLSVGGDIEKYYRQFDKEEFEPFRDILNQAKMLIRDNITLGKAHLNLGV
jgi:putative hydrolase of HD superfamily|tara:strand:+ start:143 stop:757 length:615 start_codon:yes stop_codon:yes gene_type:complete